MHVSGIGKISTPLAPNIRDRLQQLCQQTPSAEHPDEKACHVDPSLLAATNPGTLLKLLALSTYTPCHCPQAALVLTDWESTVCNLAQHLSEELGVACTENIQVVLRSATLVDQHDTFHFDSQAAAPPGTFATLQVCVLPPHTVCPCCKCIALIAA